MRAGAFFLGFAALLASRTSRADPVLALDDPLTAPIGGGQTVTGGVFSAAGWTRDSFQSQLIYDLGAPITAGRILFEMDGVNGIDHGMGGFPDCRAIFGAVDNNGSGNIDDVGNESVQFLWAWAMEETDYCNGMPGGLERTNRMKLLVHGGAPEEPGEPMSEPLAWDQAAFYVYEIGWDQSHAWLLRDGATVLDQVFPSAPVVMNMRYLFLGTVHRYDAGVRNATYRNLKVWNDAPASPPVVDGGTCLSAGPLVPANGSGPSGDLGIAYSHCEGGAAYRVVELWVGDAVDPGVPAVSVSYEGGQLHLDGSSTSCSPGDATTLHSTYGLLDCAKTSVAVGAAGVQVTWSLAFAESFEGAHKVFVDAKGGSGDPEPRLGWTEVGSFTVVAARPGEDPGAALSGGEYEGTTDSTTTSGCACRAASPASAGGAALFALALGGASAATRRRRSSSERAARQ